MEELTPERKIILYLKEKGIKRKKIAEVLDVTESNLSMILSGRRKIKLEEYLKICEFLNVTNDYFL